MPRRKQEKPQHCNDSSPVSAMNALQTDERAAERCEDLPESDIDMDTDVENDEINVSCSNQENSNATMKRRNGAEDLLPTNKDKRETGETNTTVNDDSEQLDVVSSDPLINPGCLMDQKHGDRLNLEKSDKSSSAEISEPLTYDCNRCSAVLPSIDLLKLHLASHQVKPLEQFNMLKNDAMPAANMYASACFSGSDTPLMDSSDNMEEYMVIEKQENPDLENLIKQNGSITDPNQCVICKRVLSCKSALVMHYRTHTGERPFKCGLCSRAFTTKGNLKTHMGVHKMKPSVRLQHTCPICSKQFTNAIVLNQHLKLHSDEGQRRRNAEIDRLRNIEPINNNQQEPRKGEPTTPTYQDKSPMFNPLTFPFNMIFGGLPALQEQMRYAESFSRQLEQINQISLLAGMGGAGFPLSTLSTLQQSSCLAPYISQMSKQEPTTPNNRTHETSPTSHSKAKERNAGTRSANSFEQTPTPLTTPTYLQTAHIITSPRSVKSRDGSETSSNNTITSKQDPPPGTACDICGKVVSCRSALEIHYRSHTKERPFKCDFCDKAFSTRGNMKQHMLTHKSDDLSWTLNESSSQTIYNPSGEDSAKRSPSSSKHICNICNKNFSSASAVQIHFRTHTGDRPFKCSVCGKAFTTKGNLKVHMGTHMWGNGNSVQPATSPQEEEQVAPVEKPAVSPSSTSSAASASNSTLKTESLPQWSSLSPEAIMRASSLLTNPAAMYPYGTLFSPTSLTDPNVKSWLWQVTCHVCNKDCESPAALKLHLQTHVGADNSNSKIATASI